MHFADRNNLGWLPLQHHDSSYLPELRSVPGAFRHVGWDDNDKPLVSHPGDVAGAMVWADLKDARGGMAAWFLTGAPVRSNTTNGTTTDKGWSLLRDVDTPDDRLESKDLAAPEWFKGTFPRSHTGQGSAAVEEGKQVDLLHPDFWGLYAPQKFGPASTGTYVWDLTDEAEPDPERAAQLQQLVRVADLGAGLCGFGGKVLALQLGRDDLEGKAGGLPFAEGKNTALGTVAAGGPFVGGGAFCVHAEAGPDGAVTPLHLATSALFLGLEHDGQLHFEPDTVDWVYGMRDEGIPSRVHLAWEPNLPTIAGCKRSPGRWVWYTRQSHFIGDPGGGRRKRDVIEDGFERERGRTGGGGGGDGDGFVLELPFERVTGGDTVDVFKQGFDPCDRGDNVIQQQIVSDGGKPLYATSPYMQALPGFVIKPQNPTTGAALASDEPCDWYHNTPNVVQIVGFGSQSQGDFVTTQTATGSQHAAGQGGFMILPGDVDPFAVIRGETVTSNNTVQLVIPTGLGQIALGDPLTTGKAGTGMILETGTGGRLDIKTVDSTGAVTATAYIPSGASGDISGAAGSGDVTGPAGATAGNIPQLDATGKVISDSGIAAADVVEVSGAKTQDDVIAWDASGNAVSTGVQYDEILAVSSGGAYAVIQRDSGDTAWASSTQADLRHDPNSTSWGNPAHFIQNTDNQATAQDLPGLEVATPNHLANTVASGKGGTGISLTGYGGTPTGALTGRRTSSLAGDMYFGGTSGGSPVYTLSSRPNYTSTDWTAIEGDGALAIATSLGAEPNQPTFGGTLSNNHAAIININGSLYGRDDGGNAYSLVPSPGGETDIAVNTESNYIVKQNIGGGEVTLPTSGTAQVTVAGALVAGGWIADVVTLIKTAIPTSGGITSIEIGDSTDQDRYGIITVFSANAQTDWEDWTVETPLINNPASGPTDILLTPIGGSWASPAGVILVGANNGWKELTAY